MTRVIPANVGLSDMNLTSAIDKYNNLVVERKRLLRTSSESNPAIINLNTGIEAMRHNVKTTVNSVLKGLQITRSNIDRQSRKYESRISNAPKQEQEFMTYRTPAGNQGHPLHHAAAETRGKRHHTGCNRQQWTHYRRAHACRHRFSPRQKNLYDCLCHRHRHSLGHHFPIEPAPFPH